VASGRLARQRFRALSDTEERLATQIVDSAFRVHETLGPGLLEKIYETCFCHELTKRDIRYERQAALPVIYDDMTFDEGLRIDVLVADSVVCELQAADKENPVWEAQLLSYMRLSGKRLGFLINFNVPIIKHGIKRRII